MSRPAGGLRWSPALAGRLEGARWVPSPNHDDRPPGSTVDLLVIHAISLPPDRFIGDAVESLFTNALDCDAHPYFDQLRGLRVSAHFLIRRRGEVIQFVATDARAWHAGASHFDGRERCNDFSIGIELEGTERHPFTDAQYRRLLALTRQLVQRHPLRHVAGHSDIAPGRKWDPGPQFDWARYLDALRAAGMSTPRRIAPR